jgi:hypothetical protein
MSQQTLESVDGTNERIVGDDPPPGGSASSRVAAVPQAETTGRLVFASVVLVLGGVINAAYGAVAILNDQWIVWSNRGAVFFDLTTWGWLLFGAGALAFIAGLGLLVGSPGARVLGVVMASLSLVANFFFVPAFPIWALTVMVLDILVIWAITTQPEGSAA